MKQRTFVSLLAMASLTSTSAQPPTSSQDSEHRAIIQCPHDGQTFSLKDSGETFVGEHGDIVVRGRLTQLSNDGGATFTFSRAGRLVFSKSITDLYNPNGWVSISNDQKWFAINSSNGGAAGGWSVSILQIQKNGSIRDLTASMDSVIKDFSSRHNCATRGDNYESLRWIAPDQLLLDTEVYGTSDCGSEMGYTEGFVLQPSTGKILHHYSETELLRLRGNCTYNF